MRGDKKAKLWKRTFAYIIDILVIDLIIIIPFKNIFQEFSLIINPLDIIKVNADLLLSLILLFIFTAILIILYFSILEYKIYQTLGKLILNIQVTSKLKNLTFIQCLIRNISKFSLPLLILDCLYMFKTKNQRYLEKISKTEVIE